MKLVPVGVLCEACYSIGVQFMRVVQLYLTTKILLNYLINHLIVGEHCMCKDRKAFIVYINTVQENYCTYESNEST